MSPHDPFETLKAQDLSTITGGADDTTTGLQRAATGAATGAVLGSVAGPPGAVIGAGVGAVVGWASRLFW